MPRSTAHKLAHAGAPLIAIAMLAGCSSGPSGAMMGGFAASEVGGNRASQSIAAAMGGGLIGGVTGDRLDAVDRRKALEAEYKALEYSQAGAPVAWKGNDGTSTGEVVAYQPYRVGSQDCRQYAHTVVIAGQTRSARGTACRNTDGSWTPLV
jgi:surface antigen